LRTSFRRSIAASSADTVARPAASGNMPAKNLSTDSANAFEPRMLAISRISWRRAGIPSG
jgi:hypothetical protein